MRHFTIALAVCLAAGCSDDPQNGGNKASGSKADGVALAMKYAPPGAIGAIHVDCAAVAGDFLAELRKQRKAFEDLSGAELDRIAAIVAKIDVADVFVVAGPAEMKGRSMPKVIGVFRTRLAPAEIMTVLQDLGSGPASPVKGDNGRYDDAKEGLRMIVGAEADDLDSGVVLVAKLDVLTDEFVAKLGSGDNAKLRALLGEVDTSRPLWAALGLDVVVPDKDAPIKILASLDPRGSGSGSGAFVFRNEKYGQRAAKTLGHDVSRFGDLFSTKHDGAAVTIHLKRGGPLMPRLVAAITKAMRMARESRSMSNLSNLVVGVMAYAADNDGKSPPDLKALAPYVENMPEMLKSPMSKGTLPPGESDYVYIRVGSAMRLSRPQDIMVLYERPENYDGKGTMAAFADGHVERVKDMERFKDLLAKSKALAAEREKRN